MASLISAGTDGETHVLLALDARRLATRIAARAARLRAPRQEGRKAQTQPKEIA